MAKKDTAKESIKEIQEIAKELKENASKEPPINDTQKETKVTPKDKDN